ncbi:MAG: FAD-binding oxidoreductase [Candidatus Heimdallarchaeota archaeon]|nr:FAD-binding oxidoreductase [Candidatus Heimdallarchaeota archaeon]
MKDYSNLSKWGNRVSEHTKLTPHLRKFFFTSIGMDPDGGKKEYVHHAVLEDYKKEPNLPKEFLDSLNNFLNHDQVIDDFGIRLQNSFGRSYLDLLQTRLMDFPAVAELVLYPNNHEDVKKIVQKANEYNIRVFTRAGGSSVTQGVQPIKGSIVVNITRMNKILSINYESLWVKTQTGIMGPKLEEELNQVGLTLGHFPQSWEFSCVGGWVVTRGAGQNSTLYGKIEDMVMGGKMVTGAGDTLVVKTAPARATGPELTHIISGSEGALGILTEVVLRVWKQPKIMKTSGFLFKSFEDGLLAFRELVQAGYRPAVLRLTDAEETNYNIQASNLMKDPPSESFLTKHLLNFLLKRGYTYDSRAMAILIFEGEADLVKLTQKKAKFFAKQHGGFNLYSIPGKKWIETRFETPFLRDPMVDYGMLVETFETSTTWDNVTHVYNRIREALQSESSVIMSHGSHFYQNGLNLYFTLITAQESGNEIAQFYRIKQKVLDTLIECNATISHHHGIGSSFRPWLSKEIGMEGIKILKSLKESLDPNHIMNPGVLITQEGN